LARCWARGWELFPSRWIGEYHVWQSTSSARTGSEKLANTSQGPRMAEVARYHRDRSVYWICGRQTAWRNVVERKEDYVRVSEVIAVEVLLLYCRILPPIYSSHAHLQMAFVNILRSHSRVKANTGYEVLPWMRLDARCRAERILQQRGARMNSLDCTTETACLQQNSSSLIDILESDVSRAESSRPSMRAKLPAKHVRTAQIGNTGVSPPVLTGPGCGPCCM
jgi:hypothetical protein